MKNFTPLLTLLLLFVCAIAIAQQNDTIKINRNDKGIITFAKFSPSNERALVNGQTFLKFDKVQKK